MVGHLERRPARRTGSRIVMHAHIQVIVMSGGPPPCESLSLWLSRHRLDWRTGSKEYGIDAAREHNFARFLREDVPNGKRYLLGIDHDMVPLPETESILSEPGDLLYCGYVGRHGSRGHYGDGDFGMGCFRVSATLLSKIEPPWCQTTVTDGRRVECECQWFRHRAEAAGAASKMVGHIGHEQRCILLPTSTELGWSVAWPRDLPSND